ncbi:MAG: rod-binding protein [Vulcanimicrobiaceae bacterium]
MIGASSTLAVPPAEPELSAAQRRALAQLHKAATQLEGVFLEMLFKSMRDTVPKSSIFGKASNSEHIYQSMLDDRQAQTMAQSGSFGIAKILEAQMRASVLADAKRESKTRVPQGVSP